MSARGQAVFREWSPMKAGKGCALAPKGPVEEPDFYLVGRQFVRLHVFKQGRSCELLDKGLWHLQCMGVRGGLEERQMVKRELGGHRSPGQRSLGEAPPAL